MNNIGLSLLVIGIGISMLAYGLFGKPVEGYKWRGIVGGIGAIIAGILGLFIKG